MSRLTSRPIQGTLEKMNVTLEITDYLGERWLKNHHIFSIYYKDKDKAPVVPFHEITLLYSYIFWRNLIFCAHSVSHWETEKIMFCFRTELKTKNLFTPTSNVLPFKFNYWQQKFCRVKLIQWNLVNLSAFKMFNSDLYIPFTSNL